MAARWGTSEWRNRSVSRLEELRGWLGQHRQDPGDGECARCHGDGQPEHGPDRYCHCTAGRDLLRSDIEVLSEAALTPHEDRRAA